MKIPGIKSLRRYRRWISSRLAHHALILGYHRIASTTHDPFRMCVSPDHFAEHLEVLKRHARMISLLELVESIRRAQLPERSVVLTFDDGYADIFQHAKPVLEAYQVPATVFVVTGIFGDQYWWDRLEAAISTNNNLPDPLVITIDDAPLEWRLSDQNSSEKVDLRTNFRDQYLWSVYRKLKQVDPKERDQVIARIENLAGSVNVIGEKSPRAMTVDEVASLVIGGLFEIGSHSASHPWLNRLSPVEQNREISESKSVLEQLIGRSVTSFSYPNGVFSESVVSTIRQAGFQCACGSAEDVVLSSSDPYQLPRMWIPDWDGEAFERWLLKWVR